MTRKVDKEILSNTVNVTYNDEFIEVSDSIKSIGVKIEAARSGRINGNLVFYTPKAMTQGMNSFLTPFNKHLQSKHNGEAVGVIREAEHVLEMFPSASHEFLEIIKRVKEHSEAKNGEELVKAVKELINTEEYKSPSYKGLGIATIYGDIYDPTTISKIRSKENDIGTVSIGGKSKEVYCSICAAKYTKAHEKVHKKGNYYDGELCFHINNDLYLDHCGFVTNPADKLTGTEIVKDEASEDLLNVDITHYNVQDSTEVPMTLEELKQKAKDPEAVKLLVDEYFTDKDVAEVAFTEYQAHLKNSRAPHHLLSEGNVLNLRTPVGVYIAEKLIEQFSDDDQDKSYLKDILDKAKKTLNIENLDQALQEFLDKKTKTEPEPEGTPTEEGTKQTEEPTSTEVKDSEQSLFEKITAYFDTKLEELTSKYHKVEDSEQKSALYQELKSLRENSEADEAVISALRSDLSQSLIDQIVTINGGKVSQEYLDKLKNRPLDQLKVTLEDLKESVQAKAETTEVTPDLQKTSTTDVITKVEDSQDEGLETKTANEAQPEDDTKTDPTEDDKKDEGTVVEDSQDPVQWFQQRIKEVGLAKASKEYKTKFKNK